jgi:hypothetical protein
MVFHANQISISIKDLLGVDPAAFSNCKDKGNEKKSLNVVVFIKKLSNCKPKLIG